MRDITAIPDIKTKMRDQAFEGFMLSREDESALARAWRDNKDKAAREKLVLAHQKLVVGMVRRFERSNVQFEDLMNEGMIALIIASDKYDPDSGNRFATYAQWWILTYLQETAQRDSCPVRIGKTRIEKSVFRALVRARKRHGQDLPTEVKEGIAKKMEIGVDEVERIDAATGLRSVSLNQTMGGEDDGAEFIDSLVDESQGPHVMFQATLDTTQRRVIREITAQLNPRERTVIEDRFLVDSPKTLRELASELQISAERVRQIEKEALTSMRQKIERSGIRAQDIVGEPA